MPSASLDTSVSGLTLPLPGYATGVGPRLRCPGARPGCERKREGSMGNRVTRCSAVALVLGAALLLPGVASAATPKIAVIVFENKPYGAIVGEPSASYFNSLLAQ